MIYHQTVYTVFQLDIHDMKCCTRTASGVLEAIFNVSELTEVVFQNFYISLDNNTRPILYM